MKKLYVGMLAGLAALSCLRVRCEEIGFIEDFALAPDRSVPLKQLIPGTKEYYYYHCLHYQHTGQYARVRETLKQWIDRYNYTSRVKEIENRQALLEYRDSPKKSLDHIQRRLNLRFNHQKIELDPKTDHPTSLDEDLISYRTLHQRALSRHRNLSGFEDSALGFLAEERLNTERRRDLLRRLKRPDVPGLPRLVIEDLRAKNSSGFGSHSIHAGMLLKQLDLCRKMMPELVRDSDFVNAYMRKLVPSPDVDWQHDPGEKRAYLDRMWGFVEDLPASRNSLKAHVLYRRLRFDLAQGIFDRGRFMDYLRLPRLVPYIDSDFVRQRQNRNSRANLNKNFPNVSLFPPVGMDEPLVRTYLSHFLLDADEVGDFDRYLDHDYVTEVFAETKILNGVGEMEQWYSLMPPAKYRALKERVDIELLPTNPEVIGIEDPVELNVAVKNVPSLLLKVYRINTGNYYRVQQKEVSTDVDLDGLVANVERKIDYKHVPLRRHVETFTFPEIDRRGVYVVELIGNGRSSRALIRKGSLAFTQRQGSAGHVFTVYNEAHETIMDAKLWLSGHEYAADESGEITIPYCSRTQQRKFVVSDGEFSALHEFTHRVEKYSLEAGIHVDRESLLRGEKAAVMIRPELLLNGYPVDVELLEEPTLRIVSFDLDDISTSAEVPDFKLFNDRESSYRFKVPDDLARMEFTSTGRVRNLSLNEKVDLRTEEVKEINGIVRTDKIEDLHFRHVAGEYVIELLGRTGEVKPDRAVHVEFKHRYFRESVHVVMQTDASGRIGLGRLDNIDWVKAKGPENTERRWRTVRERCSYPSLIHRQASEDIRIAFSGSAAGAKAEDLVSLLETRSGSFVRDRLGSVNTGEGFLRIDGLPAGDYEMYLRRQGVSIKIRVTEGGAVKDTLFGPGRILEYRNVSPLQIAGVDTDEDEMAIRLVNAGQATRVHVVATRYMPEYDLFDGITVPSWPSPAMLPEPRSLSYYLSGRNIGDEYRYILERADAVKYPGNLLRRPELLLNPWSLRSTETDTQKARKGEAWGAAEVLEDEARADSGRGTRKGLGRARHAAPQPALSPCLDFLENPSLVMLNLRPDDDGIVTIDAEKFGIRRQVHILAVDPFTSVYREVAFSDVSPEHRDLRLLRPFDPEGHFAEQKSISAVTAGQDFKLEDIRTGKLEVYDSLASVYSLFCTLSGDPTLAEFSFITDWPELNSEKQKELYSKFACHELSFFLFRKDPEFFRSVIRPHLANKKDRTFLDDWLLGNDLREYLEPWAFGRLNIPERILLSRRIGGEEDPVARHVRELWELVPPDAERFNYLFRTALKGSSLEAADTLGLDAAMAKIPLPETPAPAGAAGRRLAPERQQGARRMAATVAAMNMVKKGRDAKAKKMLAFGKLAEVGEPSAESDGNEVLKERLARDKARREKMRQLYSKLDKTEEWVENNYYKLPIEQQVADLIDVNGFWKDWAAHTGDGPFLSTNVAEVSGNFPEMMLALAVLDLPFKPGESKTEYEGAELTLTPGTDVIVFHREIRQAESAEDSAPMLVSQNFFARDDRYRHEDNERFDKFVTEEFQTHRVYGCQVVLTNPTSSKRKVEVLIQIPNRTIPVINGYYSRSLHRELEPYSTQTVEYSFYFPVAGDYSHFPVHVAEKEKYVAAAEAFSFHVVEKLTKIDTSSWSYISQHGSPEDVTDFLKKNNAERLDLNLIAFRMRDSEFFSTIVALIKARHIYNHALWSYGIYHNHTAAARQYLEHSPFAQRCGRFIDSELLSIDPVSRHTYQHREYSPLVNPRVYQLGRKRQILNRQFFDQYNAFLACLSYRPELEDDDRLSATYYLFLQDRVEEALKMFDNIDPGELSEDIQYDYLTAYTAFYRGNPESARKIAVKYRGYPVDRWRTRFEDVINQADEITGTGSAVADEEDRTQAIDKLADTAPGLELEIDAGRIALHYRNLTKCRMNFYLMDIELLFSRNPFVKDVSGQFAIIQPNDSMEISLPEGETRMITELPDKYRSRNVMIEAVAEGITRAQPYYPHSMTVQITENYGRLRVSGEKGLPIPKVYVKVYARMEGGSEQFYKDGYTDLRGKFDYSSLNTNELEHVERFAVLIMSEENGAVVREAGPPPM